MTVVAVIPARGGSKGIPRKNLRPLAGKPLIYYSIAACRRAKGVDAVVVTTDDDEIALFAQRFGASVIMRPAHLADDTATLDPVIFHAVEQIEGTLGVSADIVVTVQPTSPLVTAGDIEKSIALFQQSEIDTVMSVVEDRHLCWGIEAGIPFPKYEKRVNRQQLPANFKETGAVIACTRSQLTSGTRIGKRVSLYVMPTERSFDIDSLPDFYLCESMLRHRRLVFTMVGRPELGMGHCYRAAMLAHELVQFELVFVCESTDQLAADYISSLNYQVRVVPPGKLLDEVISLEPALVINDILDTDLAYIQALKAAGIRVVNFEDLGPGSEQADLVFNALYPHQLPSPNLRVGARYFCLRDEFLHLPARSAREVVKRVLLTFGGTDENNLTSKVLTAIAPVCAQKGIDIDVVVGPGFRHHTAAQETIASLPNVCVNYVAATTRISDFMCNADIAITSGGRTVFELTATLVPTIAICQNQRETTHTFASSENGIINLGLCHDVSGQRIAETFLRVVEDGVLRSSMAERMAATDLAEGKNRVIKEIVDLAYEG